MAPIKCHGGALSRRRAPITQCLSIDQPPNALYTSAHSMWMRFISFEQRASSDADIWAPTGFRPSVFTDLVLWPQREPTYPETKLTAKILSSPFSHKPWRNDGKGKAGSKNVTARTPACEVGTGWHPLHISPASSSVKRCELLAPNGIYPQDCKRIGLGRELVKGTCFKARKWARSVSGRRENEEWALEMGWEGGVGFLCSHLCRAWESCDARTVHRAGDSGSDRLTPSPLPVSACR